MKLRVLCFGLLALAATGFAQVEALKKESETLTSWVKTDLARAFLAETANLPAVSARVMMRGGPEGWYSQASAAKLDDATKAALKEFKIDEARYYNTFYGSPLAYVRALDVAAQHGLTVKPGTKILDFGYGSIGHLRLLANLGAEVHGVEVDPFLRELYSGPGDTGAVGAKGGKITLHHGRFPADPPVKSAIGGGYDFIMSKNTLKRGYIRPERQADPNQLVKLGVDDKTFMKELFDALKPGGLLLIYNLSPKQNPPDKPYLPMANGLSPFDKPEWEAAGFKVIAFDVDDSVAAKELGRILGWDRGNPTFLAGLSGHYTLLQRPA